MQKGGIRGCAKGLTSHSAKGRDPGLCRPSSSGRRWPQRTGTYCCVFLIVRETEGGPAAVQAIEFWSTLAEIEASLLEAEEEDLANSAESECKKFLERCATELLPLLLDLLLQQSEDQDNDETDWCACSLSLFSGVCSI